NKGSRIKIQMQISGRQVTAARNLLGITQEELADAVGVERTSIARFEAGLATPWRKNLEKNQNELEGRGIDFINGEGPGVRLNVARAAEYARAETRPLH